MKKKLKVLLLFDSPYFMPRGYDFNEELRDPDWDTERDVYRALQEIGHDVNVLGLHNDIGILLEEIKENRPDIVFNLTEVFNEKPNFDKNVVWLLEMLQVPYTGVSPSSLLICNNKALSKKILTFHKIKVPDFQTFHKNHRVELPKTLKPPLIVKPLCEEASRGISQASVAGNEKSFIKRVNFIHKSMNMDAIAEEYIEGRELYISVLGNRRIKILPPREMTFGQFPEDEPRIGTYKAKWDDAYRKRWGIKNVFAERLPDGVGKKIEEICKKAYRVLNMQCYARIDIRIAPDSTVYILEANANPCLARDDEIARPAERSGIPYNKLIRKIINLAFQRNR